MKKMETKVRNCSPSAKGIQFSWFMTSDCINKNWWSLSQKFKKLTCHDILLIENSGMSTVFLYIYESWIILLIYKELTTILELNMVKVFVLK